MVTGFLRIKRRRERRPEMPIESRWQHSYRRVREIAGEMKARVKLFWELQELWLQTRKRTAVEHQVADILHDAALTGQRAKLRLADWQAAFAQAQAEVPSKARLWLARWNLLSLKWTYTREDLNSYWRSTREKISRHAYLKVNWLRVSWRALRELTISARFALSMFTRASVS